MPSRRSTKLAQASRRSTNLTVLLTWYQHANVAKMKKDEKLAAWVVIVSSGRAPPPYERWTGVDDAKLLEAQSDIVEMAHTALGHLKELKKKELVLASITMSNEEFDQVTVAYEPIWAIGTGRTASSQQAQEMHAYIREQLSRMFDAEAAFNTSILYGGSCNPGNAKELFSQEDVDGGLIGGASLKSRDFTDIVKSF